VAEFISAWGDGRAQAPPLRMLPPVIARLAKPAEAISRPPLSLRGARFLVSSEQAPQSRSDGIATHPEGARNDSMRKDENMKRIRFSDKARKTLRGRSRGFTLIEVLIALALFAIIAIVFAGGLSTASRAVLIADVRTRAESLARTQMESIKSQNYIAANQTPWQVLYRRMDGIPTGYFICSVNTTTNQTANCGSSPTLSIIAIALNSTTSDSGLQKITLVIKHGGTDAATSREVTRLEGYKVDR